MAHDPDLKAAESLAEAKPASHDTIQSVPGQSVPDNSSDGHTSGNPPEGGTGPITTSNADGQPKHAPPPPSDPDSEEPAVLVAGREAHRRSAE